MNGIVVIAFDRVSGQVHGTFVHGFLGDPNAANVARSRERLVGEVAERLGGNGTSIDVLELPLHELPMSVIERIDPASRRLVTRPPKKMLPQVAYPSRG